MSKTSLAAAILLLSAAAMPAHAQSSIAGRWVTENNRAVVNIQPCGNAFCGRVERILVDEPGAADARDRRNPDPSLRDRRIVGSRILWGFTRNGNAYSGGRLYDPESGRTVDGRLALNGNRLRVTGCVLGGTICRTQNWTRRR
ncbi:MAG: DUF2147 domain-containing protein [Parasphingopyxis sp.]|nr:DUF2147 domain-containing protein [Sphingomonadales bacterium]